MYFLIPICLCLAGLFLWQESKKNYVPAVILKGLASLCFVILGGLLSTKSQQGFSRLYRRGRNCSERLSYSALYGIILS